MRLSVLPLLLACDTPPEDPSEAVTWAQALASGDCAPVRDEALHDACVVAAVERTRKDRCSEAKTPRGREECAFRLAERTLDAARCREAGTFAEDCALHVLSTGFLVWAPEGARPGGPEEQEVAARIAAAGLSAEDPRPWSAWYRWSLGAMPLLDRAACVRVESPKLREACVRTGIALYEDRLRRARDTGELPCSPGAPLPKALAHAPDPELDALLQARRPPCR